MLSFKVDNKKFEFLIPIEFVVGIKSIHCPEDMKAFGLFVRKMLQKYSISAQ